VRLHRFSDLDNDVKDGMPVNRHPSFSEMSKLAVSDESVSLLLNQERYAKATQDFSMALDDNASWMTKLDINSNTGSPAKTVDNICIIIENDPALKGKIAFDEFSNRCIVLGELPWEESSKKRDWGNSDDSGLIRHLEKVYNIYSPPKTDNALGLAARLNKINYVKSYLTSLEWDGIRRLDTLFIDYLGASDNPYVRTVTRKSIVAAVARAMTPGIKHDEVLILTGPQGVGKSTLLRLLGKQWYSDSLHTFEGKEAAELIQGVWINELGELNTLNRSESEIAKQFLSKTEDIYREPFGKRTMKFPRRCVFFGTSNKDEFLKDFTGDRRYWPVTIREQEPTKNVFNDLENEVDLIWAEAYTRWQLGEPLYLPREIEEMAKIHQESHRERSAREGVVREFIEKKVPEDWIKWPLERRRIYWSGNELSDNIVTVDRSRICALEVWCECLGGDLKYIKYSDSTEINGIIKLTGNWTKQKYGSQHGYCGCQRGFER
jgi:predicted P-loop ATPase